MISFPNTAFFPNAPEAKNSGVDFLALGTIGERLIAYGLPGITNVTRFLRPYSVASWVAWRFDEELKALSGQRLPKHQKVMFREFREKVELLFSWANSGVVRSIGNDRNYPEHSNSVDMCFNNPAFGSENQASWFAAAAYGPSFSEPGGLGFITRHNGIYRPTNRGRQLALALDAVMSRRKTHYDRVRNVTERELSRRDVIALKNGLSLSLATSSEKKLFQSALYQERLIGKLDDPHGNRATSLTLMIRVLETAGPSDEEGVRQAMAIGRTSANEVIPVDGLEKMQRVWLVLAIRQLQRVALERLLRWFELTITEHTLTWCDLRVIQDDAVAALLVENSKANSRTVGQHLDKVRAEILKNGGIQQAMLHEPSLNAFELRRNFEHETLDDHGTIPARSLYCLLYCAVLFDLLKDDREYSELCKMGGRERISISWFANFANERRSQTLAEFTQESIVALIYAQHLQTAATRVEEGKNKFRFAMDDSGLKLLVDPKKVNSQLGTPDRIRNALLLMSECGLVTRFDDGRFGAAK